jgi:hypothetical protein
MFWYLQVSDFLVDRGQGASVERSETPLVNEQLGSARGAHLLQISLSVVFPVISLRFPGPERRTKDLLVEDDPKGILHELLLGPSSISICCESEGLF